MTTPNWGLLQNNALANVGYGLQLGQSMVDRREARAERNALLDMQRKREERLQRADEQQLQQQQQTQQRNDLPIIARLLEGAQDDASYRQALTAAQRYGIDVSDAPPNFDPQWREQTLMIAKAAQTPQGQEALSNAGKQAVDAGYRPGTPEFNNAVRQIVTADMAQPYMGSQGETRLYTPDVFGGGGPVQGGAQGPQPGVVEDGYRFKGGNPADPSNWEPVQGGPTLSASGGFRPVGIEGERVTSTVRSPSRNRAVGGVANSYHLTGQARDSVPPPGMSMGEYYRRLKAANPHLDVINEGDHVHMEPKG